MNTRDDLELPYPDLSYAIKTDSLYLNEYIVELKQSADRIRNRKTPPFKGQIPSIIIVVFLVLISSLMDSKVSGIDGLFMGIILVRICWTGRDTVAGFYEEAAKALESFRDNGAIPEIEKEEEAIQYVCDVIKSCREGLDDNTVRTPKQWLKKTGKKAANTQ